MQDAVKERLMRAYFTEGEPIGEPEVLVRLAREAGLDGRRGARDAGAATRYAREVRADEEEAQALGIGGVPFFVIDGRYGVSGAQPAEVLLQVLTRGVERARGASRERRRGVRPRPRGARLSGLSGTGAQRPAAHSIPGRMWSLSTRLPAANCSGPCPSAV